MLNQQSRAIRILWKCKQRNKKSNQNNQVKTKAIPKVIHVNGLLTLFQFSYPYMSLLLEPNRSYRPFLTLEHLCEAENTEFQKHKTSPPVFLPIVPSLPEQEGRTHMENFLPAVLGELMTRPINFIISKCSKPPAMAMEESLQRALLQAQVIDEEAMGRHITNQAMIQQLGMLRDAVHRGYYALDVFRYQPHCGEDDNDPAIRGFMSLSKVPSPKDPYFFGQTAQFRVQLQGALDRLTSTIVDLNESVMFLMSCPRLYRQPYSMHILLGNCMFGRQMEAELVIKFLLHTHPHCSQELEVLPIVGPPRVGKSTLVAHVCKDKRVRDYFSEILWLRESDFTNAELPCRQGSVMKHQNCMPNSNGGKRLLVVIELCGNLYEDAWNRLYLGSGRSFPSGSKIIVTSHSDTIVKFGTTPALTLKPLSHEAYWYFFKALTFGSMNPKEHPMLAQLSMEIARLLYGSFHGAYISSDLLRKKFNIHFWCKYLSFLRGFIQKHVSEIGENPFDLLNQNRPVQHVTMATPSKDLTICHQYHCSSQEEVPEITIQDVLYGSTKRHGKFEVLVWRSQIPPYYSYVNVCEIRERKITGTKRKHPTKDLQQSQF